MKNCYTIIDSFCGAGGLSHGLEQARQDEYGFRTLTAFDLDEMAIETYQKNVSPCGFQADATTLDSRSLRQQAQFNRRLDLFAGGPPCQGFSKQKRGAHLGDDRNDLVLHFARLVRELSPRFFLLENVDQLGQKRGRDFITHVHQELMDYHLYPSFYNCADYGLAQTRVRFIIIGRHRDVSAPFHLPRPTISVWATVGEALAGLPEPPEDYSEHPDYPNHQRARVTQPNIERFSYVPQGGGWQDIPAHLRLKCHQDVNTASGGWPDVYGRLHLNGQAPTITGGFDSFTRGRYGHPLQNRPLTPREAARLQGFPDTFRFSGTRGHVRAQIGNAVPPPLAKALGEAILKSLLVADGLTIANACLPHTQQRFGFITD